MGSGSSMAHECAVVKHHELEKVQSRHAQNKRIRRVSSSSHSSKNSAPKHVRFATTVSTCSKNDGVVSYAMCELGGKSAVASERQVDVPRRVASESSLHVGSLEPRKCQASLIVQEGGQPKELPKVCIRENTWLDDLCYDIGNNDHASHACGNPVRFLRRKRVESCAAGRIRQWQHIRDIQKHLQIVDTYDHRGQQPQDVTIQASVLTGGLQSGVDFEIGDEVTLDAYGPWRAMGKGVVIGSADKKGYLTIEFLSTHETVHIKARSLTKVAKIAKAPTEPKESVL